MRLAQREILIDNLSFNVAKVYERENYRYLDLFTNVLFMTHGPTTDTCQRDNK